jgi:hypothetical protein
MSDQKEIGELNEMLNDKIKKYNKSFVAYRTKYNRYRGNILKSELSNIVELSTLLIQYYDNLNKDPNIGMIDDNIYIEPPPSTKIINGKFVIE